MTPSPPPNPEIERITANLRFLEANPTARFPHGWVDEVKREARAAGLLPPLATRQTGVNCQPGIDAQITYGGDMPDVF